jgi:uncharacterized protein YndB with AHSA1/START domain
MLRIVRYVGAGLALLAMALFIYASTQPAVFRVERTATISAPPAVVFAILNDLHRGQEWSPYEKLDPAMKKTFGGPETGPGATYAWNGNDEVGEGSLTITESKPGESVAMKLKFSRPMECESDVIYKLAPVDGGTSVSWIMEGPNTLMSKLMSLFVNMDEMIGKDFEQGLTNLNVVAQADAQKATAQSSEPVAP